MRHALLILALAGCGSPPTEAMVQEKVFNVSCNFAACHLAQGSDGLNLEAPVRAKIVGVSAQAVGVTDKVLVVPGKPEQSYLYLKLTQAQPAVGVRMPSGGDPLDATQLALVKDWIAAGCPK